MSVRSCCGSRRLGFGASVGASGRIIPVASLRAGVCLHGGDGVIRVTTTGQRRRRAQSLVVRRGMEEDQEGGEGAERGAPLVQKEEDAGEEEKEERDATGAQETGRKRWQKAVSLPDSMEDAMAKASEAFAYAGGQGYRRVIIEVDLSAGDETYTLLRNSLPLVRQFAVSAFGETADGVRVVFPDTGSAALAKRDWSELEGATMVGLQRSEISKDDVASVLVSPRASEVEALADFIDRASPVFKAEAKPLIMFNPDLVDMGVTGLSLTARQLRENVVSTFETVFYLRTLSWGAVYRCYPSGWTVWREDAAAEGGFRLLETLAERPSGEELENLLEASEPDADAKPKRGFFDGLRRFLAVYSKG